MSQFIKDTAQAWGIPQKKVQRLHEWVGEKVAPQWQWSAFVKLLRKEYQPVVSPVPKTLTKEYIESKPHTKAQLAQWGIAWPPTKGWKRRLIKGE